MTCDSKINLYFIIIFMFQTKSVFGPYAYGPDQIRFLIWSDHTRMVINELDQIGI
jgi:hypothetical protein